MKDYMKEIQTKVLELKWQSGEKKEKEMTKKERGEIEDKLKRMERNLVRRKREERKNTVIIRGIKEKNGEKGYRKY